MRAALWLIVLVGCGEHAGQRCNDTNICIPDALHNTCAVLAQTGCLDGEKCTSGHQFTSGIGCLPDGEAAIGEPCVIDTESNDSCRGGGYCGPSNVCVLICDATAPSCPEGSYCSLSTNRFIDDDGRIVAGVCLPL